jgi:hypothetical protein
MGRSSLYNIKIAELFDLFSKLNKLCSEKKSTGVTVVVFNTFSSANLSKDRLIIAHSKRYLQVKLNFHWKVKWI